VFAIRLALALPLYWLASSVVAYIQQARVLREDATEADALVNKPGGLKVTRKTVDAVPDTQAKKPSPKNKKASRNKRRRR